MPSALEPAGFVLWVELIHQANHLCPCCNYYMINNIPYMALYTFVLLMCALWNLAVQFQYIPNKVAYTYADNLTGDCHTCDSV